MRPSFLSRATLFSLSTTLAVLAVACSKDKLLTTTVFNSGPTPTVTPTSPTPPPATNFSPVVDPHSYELGLDKAASGLTISKSANSKEDWNLVVSQFQDAIALMKQVREVSPDFPSAQRKIKEYQIQIKYAKHKANSPVLVLPQPEPQPVVEVVPTSTPLVSAPLQRTVNCSNPRSASLHRCPSLLVKRTPIPIPVPSPEPLNQQPEVFTVPIKRRAGGTPIIEVTFNGNQQFDMILDTGASGTVITQEMANALGIVPVGKAKANTASSKAVVFPIGYVDSIEVGGVMVHQTAVAIAGSDLETGLLGHDFFGEYDITIKRDVVEFRPQSNSQINSAQTEITPTPPLQRDFVESP